MTKEQKIERLNFLRNRAYELKKEADYYNALQLALKLVLNGSYGAFATPYFVLYNNYVASSITAQGRDLTKTMNRVNEYYWYNLWHGDIELHTNVCIRNVTQIVNDNVSIYADTDSLFVSFKPAMDHCDWKNIFFNNLDKLSKKYVVIQGNDSVKTDNKNCIGIIEFDYTNQESLIQLSQLISSVELVIVDGKWIKNRHFENFIKEYDLYPKIKWNWSNELDFIQGLDYYRYAGYFKKCLEEYAGSYGVQNKEDFELERISESVIYVAKKKYIQHIVYEDGIPYDKLSYIYPKGVELVRRSTPLFARDKIVNIIKYLFSNPDTFNIRELLKLVKTLKKEFDLCVPNMIDDISMQSSCSKYSGPDGYVVQDEKRLEFKLKTPASVKAAAYYNFLLHKNKDLQSKYEFFKSGSKIKYYYCKDKSINKIFAFMRGSYPIEFAPEIDLDLQFAKCILSPINSIIEPLGLPEITKRLSVILDIFGGELKKKAPEVIDETDDLENDGNIYDDNGDVIPQGDEWDNI
jgi:DNA polymerase elongation subunit (family B)